LAFTTRAVVASYYLINAIKSGWNATDILLLLLDIFAAAIKPH